jgi:hypothetical protein
LRRAAERVFTEAVERLAQARVRAAVGRAQVGRELKRDVDLRFPTADSEKPEADQHDEKPKTAIERSAAVGAFSKASGPPTSRAVRNTPNVASTASIRRA